MTTTETNYVRALENEIAELKAEKVRCPDCGVGTRGVHSPGCHDRYNGLVPRRKPDGKFRLKGKTK